MESVAFIQWCLEHLNYWTITLLMTIESKSTACRIVFRQAWRTLHIHRSIDSGSTSADFHTGRTCPHENAHLPAVHYYRSRIMEHHPGCYRLLPVNSARHRKRRTTDRQSYRIQPRNRLLLHRHRNIHRRLPGL